MRANAAHTALRLALYRVWLGSDGMGWDGRGWEGMGWDGMGRDGMGSDGTAALKGSMLKHTTAAACRITRCVRRRGLNPHASALVDSARGRRVSREAGQLSSRKWLRYTAA